MEGTAKVNDVEHGQNSSLIYGQTVITRWKHTNFLKSMYNGYTNIRLEINKQCQNNVSTLSL